MKNIRMIGQSLFCLLLTIVFSISVGAEDNRFCDITDTDEDQCALCYCYSESGKILKDEEIIGMQHVLQAHVAHPGFENTTCKALYDTGMTALSHPNRILTMAGLTKGAGLAHYGGSNGYRREMLDDEKIERCKTLIAKSKDVENPGHLFHQIKHAEPPRFLSSLGCTRKPITSGTKELIEVFHCPDLENQVTESGNYKRFMEWRERSQRR